MKRNRAQRTREFFVFQVLAVVAYRIIVWMLMYRPMNVMEPLKSVVHLMQYRCN